MKIRAFIFSLITALSTPVAAQDIATAPGIRTHAEAIAAARTIIAEFMDEHQVPGMSVAVGIDGQTVWSEGFGYADLENRVHVTPLTKFRIGSVSKTLTADGMAILVDEGRLHLDAPIQTYVRNFPEKRWTITSRQVGGHLAGIRHYRGSESITAGQLNYRNVTTALRIFRDDSLLFEPGTQYSYSSFGWNLLSAVMQGAEDEPFLEFMDRKVFEPLGMLHTVADHVDSIIPHRSSFYQRRGGKVVNAVTVNNSYKWAGGGFLSNMEDLLRFAWAHYDSAYISPETVELFWTSQRLADGSPTNYGIGWRVVEDADGRRIVGHGGSSVGGRTQFILYRDLKIAVAVTANLSEAPVSSALAQQIASGFLPN